jgi:uridine kinase
MDETEMKQDYSDVADALASVLNNLPPKIIAINGRPGVGKTTLGRFLACRFEISLIETDLFLKGNGRLEYRHCDAISHMIEVRINRKDRPVIVEGVAVLRLLDELERKPDFVIYIESKDDEADKDGGSAWLKDLWEYEANFSPRDKADLKFPTRADQ